jgi:MFS family permease
MPFFVGFIVDKLSLRIGVIMATGCVLVGQTAFSIGVQLRVFFICILGRFILGLGGEAIAVAQFKFAAKWFPGPQMGFFYGLLIGFARFGTVLNFVLSPVFAEYSFVFSIWFGTGICVLSFILAYFTGIVDSVGEERLLVSVEDTPPQSLRDVLLDIKYVFQLPALVWFLVMVIFWFSIAYITILATTANLLHKSGYYYPVEEAAGYVAVPSIVGIAGPPIFGKITDRVGRCLWWGLASCFLLVLALCGLLMLTERIVFIHPVIIMIMIGFAYSIYISSLLTLVPFVVPEHTVGRVSGLITVTENIGYIVIPSLIGIFQTDDQFSGKVQYALTVDILIILGLLAYLCSITLILIDLKRTGGALNSTPDEKNAFKDLLNQPRKMSIAHTQTDDLPRPRTTDEEISLEERD